MEKQLEGDPRLSEADREFDEGLEAVIEGVVTDPFGHEPDQSHQPQGNRYETQHVEGEERCRLVAPLADDEFPDVKHGHHDEASECEDSQVLSDG